MSPSVQTPCVGYAWKDSEDNLVTCEVKNVACLDGSKETYRAVEVFLLSRVSTTDEAAATIEDFTPADAAPCLRSSLDAATQYSDLVMAISSAAEQHQSLPLVNLRKEREWDPATGISMT